MDILFAAAGIAVLGPAMLLIAWPFG